VEFSQRLTRFRISRSAIGVSALTLAGGALLIVAAMVSLL